MYIIGIDEVGRGPVAGPVVVCACAVRTGTDVVAFYPKQQLRDSKKLSEKHRQEILKNIQPLMAAKDVIFGIGEVSAEEIDTIGISPAIKKATMLALNELHAQGVSQDSFVFLDGSLHAEEKYTQETIIKGDEKVPEISLASIHAKEYRDSRMKKNATRFPMYGFEDHVGYGTKAHYAAIKKHGLIELHRRSFLTRL
jgi:ribonuclease HII